MSSMAWTIAGVFVAGLAAVAMVQVLLAMQLSRMRGKPAPKLSGVMGEAVASGKEALFYFHSPTCGPCRAMTPTIRELATRHPRVFEVDVTRDFDTARRFGVMGTPTTVLVRDGMIEDVKMGARPEKEIAGLLAV